MSRAFTAASSHKLTRTTAVVSPHPCTLACWFKSSDAAAIQTLIACGNSANDTAFFGMRLRGDIAGDPVQAYFRDNAAVTDVANTSSGYSTGTWHHACVVFSSSTSRTAYIDGASSGSNATAQGTTTVDRTSVGALERLTPIHYMQGSIAEACVYDVALTAAEVASLAKAYSPLLVRPESLVAYWPLIGRLSPEIDVVQGLGLTVTGAVYGDHPRIVYPRGRIIVPLAATPAASKAFYFRNYILSRGIA